MKQSTLDKLATAITEPDEMIDPSLILAFMSAIITAWKNCSNPEVAKAQTLAGGPVAYGQAIRIVRSETDLRGKAARLKAMELVKAGTKLTPEELADMENEAKDVPPNLSIPVGIFQLSLIMFCILLFTAPAHAQSGIFQIDIEQNRRLDQLEKKVDDIAVRIGIVSPVVTAPAAKALQSAPAYEIINGVRTHTSDAHLRFHGYTDAQIAGLSPEQKDRLHGAAHNGNFAVAGAVVAPVKRIVTVSAAFVDVCNGRKCRRIRRP